MKRIITVTLALMLCLTLAVSVSAAGVTVTVENKSITLGTTSTDISFDISGNAGIAGIGFWVNYPAELKLTAMTAGEALSGLTLGKPGNLNANPIKVGFDGEIADNTNGTFLTLTFNVPADVAATYPITLTPIKSATYDNDLDDVDLNAVSGSIQVVSAGGGGGGSSSGGGSTTEDLPEISSSATTFNCPYTYVDDSGKESTVPAGIVFGRAVTEYNGYTLSEYGMLFSKNEISAENFKKGLSSVKKAKGVEARNNEGYFGILFYGNAIKYGQTYYTIPYAVYKKDNKTITVYGENVVTFTPEAK